MPNTRRALGRAVPTLGMVFALTAMPTVSIPLLSGSNSSANAATKVVRIPIVKAQKVSVPKAGSPTAIEAAPDADVPDLPANKAARGPQSPLTPGRDDDLVADIPLTDGGGLVALSWADNARPNTAADLLFRTEGVGGWSGWRHIGPSGDTDSEATATTRIGTDPFWVPDAQRIQIRSSMGQATDFTNAELTVIVPSSVPAAGAPAASASAEVSPQILTRTQWGADERLRGGCVPGIASTTKAAVVHHTADSNDYAASDSAAIVRSILAYHTQSLGWCDIGYNALVDKYGQMFEGRIGGLQNPVIGAHALGFNNMTFGVSILGNYETATLPAAGRTALTTVLAMRLHDFYVNPQATTQLTSADSGSRYPRGSTATLPVITGHRDTFATACPGANVYPLLPTIRTETQSKGTFSASTIYQRWQSLGGASGQLGLPSVGETRFSNLWRTAFQDYNVIWGTPAGTARIGSGIDAMWFSAGGPGNGWGYPRDEYSVPNGTRVDFTERGVSAIWTPRYGSVATNGTIKSYWEARGAMTSTIGVPTTQMREESGGGYSQQFSRQRVWWTFATGTKATEGGIGAMYVAAGGSSSRLGYPAAEMVTTATAWYQVFQGGRITWPRNGSAPYMTYF